MILSSLGGSLTNKFFQVGGTRQSAAAFSNIWNTAQGAKPADPLSSTDNGCDFGTIPAVFFQSPGLPNSKWGVKPTGIANALCAFMYGYAAWANQTLNGTNFCFGSDASVGNPHKTAEYALILNALGCFTLQSGGARVAPYP